MQADSASFMMIIAISDVGAASACLQVVFEDASGRYTMFDFGPIGGDVHVGGPNLRPTGKRKRVKGEVRHTQVRHAA